MNRRGRRLPRIVRAERSEILLVAGTAIVGLAAVALAVTGYMLTR